MSMTIMLWNHYINYTFLNIHWFFNLKFNSLNYILALHFSQGVHILAFYVAKIYLLGFKN
jgi:hypothetical protein